MLGGYNAVQPILSAFGTFLGCRLGAQYKSAAERIGGVLIGLGVKILWEHLH